MYEKGLALSSMEAREAKHQAISRYAQNSNFLNHWKQVFRHEFVFLILLRERGYSLTTRSSIRETYIPKRAFQVIIVTVVSDGCLRFRNPYPEGMKIDLSYFTSEHHKIKKHTIHFCIWFNTV